MQPTITPPKTFKLKTHLVFTTIDIEKTRPFFYYKYSAKFSHGLSNEKMTKTELTASNIEKLIENIEKFLDCKIDERHYIVK